MAKWATARREFRHRAEAVWGRVSDWPLAARDLLAASVCVLAIGASTAIVLLGGTELERTATLVATQKRETATVVGIAYSRRSGDVYRANLDGQEMDVHFAGFVEGPNPGDFLEVVRDPKHSNRVLSVGAPGDWEGPNEDHIVLSIFLTGIALAIGAVAAANLVPERSEPLLERGAALGDRFRRTVDRAPQRWFGGQPPTGRHRAD